MMSILDEDIAVRQIQCFFLVIIVFLCVRSVQASDGAVQIYSQDELIELINENKHLKRVRDDDCQLLQDIEARATIMKLPSYQFLYGDMLAYGVCVKKNVVRGVYLMKEAAAQGLPAGLEQLGRYYHTGKLVQKDLKRAIMYLREAAFLGNLPARVRLAEIYVAGHGSPREYEAVYRWLFHTVTDDKKLHAKIRRLLESLAQNMPPSVVARARKGV